MPGGWDGAGNVYNYDGTHTGDNCVSQQTTAEKTAFDTMFTTVTNAIENCVARDGQNSPSANLPMNSKKLTGLTTGSALTDSVNASQLVNSSLIWGGTSTGAANNQSISVPIAPASYGAGRLFAFIAGYTNTGAFTLNVNGLGSTSVINNDDSGSALRAGQVALGCLCIVLHNGTVFKLLNPNSPSYQYTPTVTGTAGSWTLTYYTLLGKQCTVYFDGAVTSNSTGFTITVPLAPNADVRVPIIVQDSGSIQTTPGLFSLDSGTTTATLYKTPPTGAWTASLIKGFWGSITYMTS